MDFSLICRTCMNGGDLCPIFRDKEDNETYSKTIYETTGVKVQHNDNLPQNMCTVCINRINDSQKFRNICQETEIKLLKMVVKEESIVIDDYSKKNTRTMKKRNILKSNIKDVIKLKTESVSNGNDCYIKAEMDSDDDQPLKKLLSSPISDIKQYETCPEEIFEDSNIKSDTEIETDLIANIPDEIGLIQTINDVNDTKLKQNSNIESLLIEPLKLEVNSSKNLTNDIKQESLYEFIQNPVNEKSRKVLCKLCNKELAASSIDGHLNRRHPGADGRKVKCELCDTYVMKQKINRHVLVMHGKECLKCGYCKSEFDSKEALIDHGNNCNAKTKKRKRSEAGRELVACEICNQTMQKASLRMHKAVKHAGLRPVCEHCGKSFGNKYRLNEHCRAKHGYEKFKCSYCDFKSASIMAMRNHERRHRGEKPYACGTCGAKFHAAYLLAQHKQSHNIDKVNKCDLCPASFKSRNGVHMHKLNCHSSTTARCSVCGRSYKSRVYAAKHARHVHRCLHPRDTPETRRDDIPTID